MRNFVLWCMAMATLLAIAVTSPMAWIIQKRFP